MSMDGGDGRSGSMQYGGGTRGRHWSAHRGPGEDIWHGWQTRRKRKIKKHDKKPATKTTNKGKRVQPRSHHRGIVHQKPKVKETGQKHVKTYETSPKQHGQ